MHGREVGFASALALLAVVACFAACGGADGPTPATAHDDSGFTEAADSDLPDEIVPETIARDSSGDDIQTIDTGTEPADTREAGPEILTCTGSQFEPNGSEGSALVLGDITDCDGTGGSFSGIVAGGADVDWWEYHGKDTFGCIVDETASTKSPVRLCMFVTCTSGATEFKSCPKGTKAISPAGNIGCCADSSGNVQVQHKCTLVGTDDSAKVFLRIDSSAATSCTPYKVSYHF